MTKKQMRILLDVDGVLGSFCEDILEQSKSGLTVDDINDWEMFEKMTEQSRTLAFEILKTVKFWEEMSVYPFAKEMVANFQRMGEVYFLTAPWADRVEGWKCKEWGNARTHWIKKHFDADFSRVIIAYSKGPVKGDVLIDDRLKNVEEWQRDNPDGRAFLFERPYSRNYPWPYRARLGTNGWEFKVKGEYDWKLFDGSL